MILIIDNYDSFTYNLVQQLETLGAATIVQRNDVTVDEIAALKPSGIIISPGPGAPADAGISNSVIRQFYSTIPLLGVCLGMQCIGDVFGAHITHAKNIMHGKVSKVRHTNTQLFKNLPQDFTVARYHSLAVTNIQPPLVATAWADDGEVMALMHSRYPLFGIQFHPESFLSEHGSTIMENFLACTRRS